MRILIDECLDWRLCRALTGHEALSVKKMGWSGIKNGHLLSQAVQNGFEVLLTGDKNLSFQQNAENLRISVVVLAAPGIQLSQTLPLMSKVLSALVIIKLGQIVTITT